MFNQINLKEMKQICPIHRFMYNGSVCPLCEKERIDRLASEFVNSGNEERVSLKKEKKLDREINENDINKLLEKFGKK